MPPLSVETSSMNSSLPYMVRSLPRPVIVAYRPTNTKNSPHSPKLVLLSDSLAKRLISGAHFLKKPRSTCIGVSTRKPSMSVDSMSALAAAMCFACTDGLSVRRSSMMP